ncbi:MAG: antitoxin family protein [Chloroflexi bacterium]|nr:antitoxin family protein [Chloroflexota bacterium]
MATIRARYEKGVLTPLEPLDLEEGKEVVVSVEDVAAGTDKNHVNASASPESSSGSRGLTGIVERVKELQESMPPEEFDGVPSDGAKNFKHYLYGHPRVED